MDLDGARQAHDVGRQDQVGDVVAVAEEADRAARPRRRGLDARQLGAVPGDETHDPRLLRVRPRHRVDEPVDALLGPQHRQQERDDVAVGETEALPGLRPRRRRAERLLVDAAADDRDSLPGVPAPGEVGDLARARGHHAVDPRGHEADHQLPVRGEGEAGGPVVERDVRRARAARQPAADGQRADAVGDDRAGRPGRPRERAAQAGDVAPAAHARAPALDAGGRQRMEVPALVLEREQRDGAAALVQAADQHERLLLRTALPEMRADELNAPAGEGHCAASSR